MAAERAAAARFDTSDQSSAWRDGPTAFRWLKVGFQETVAAFQVIPSPGLGASIRSIGENWPNEIVRRRPTGSPTGCTGTLLRCDVYYRVPARGQT